MKKLFTLCMLLAVTFVGGNFGGAAGWAIGSGPGGTPIVPFEDGAGGAGQ